MAEVHAAASLKLHELVVVSSQHLLHVTDVLGARAREILCAVCLGKKEALRVTAAPTLVVHVVS